MSAQPAAKIGRPEADVDAEAVVKLASIGCTGKEIALMVGTSEATISRRFASEIDKGRSQLHKSLRRKQLEVALGGNIAMLIWLGKQFLGQTDKQDIQTTKREIRVRIGGEPLEAKPAGDDNAEV